MINEKSQYELVCKEHFKRNDEAHDRMCTKLDRIDKLLRGDEMGNPGVVGRLDRLEHSESRRVWTVRAVLIAVLGLLVDAVRGWIIGRT